MRILQTIILSSLLLLIASNAYPQKDKSLQNVFIPEGYALDRNQVQYNQPKDFKSFLPVTSPVEYDCNISLIINTLQ